jgi:hypothetical protein
MISYLFHRFSAEYRCKDVNMPSNTDFSVSVLVGSTVLPEYLHNGVNYVECDLFSPVSFKQRTEERVGDEIEMQVSRDKYSADCHCTGTNLD